MQCDECKSALRKDKLTGGHWCPVCSFENAHREKLAAQSELAAMRQRIVELESAQSNQADSLRHWSDLWTHINKRLSGNDYDLLPTSANFDAMSDSLIGRVNELEAAQATDYWRGQYDQLASAVAELHEFELLEDAQSIVTPKNCPSCTWRGEVELSGGVCPQCGINWKSIVKPQSQAALKDQLDELVKIANINGLYDAADFVANRK